MVQESDSYDYDINVIPSGVIDTAYPYYNLIGTQANSLAQTLFEGQLQAQSQALQAWAANRQAQASEYGAGAAAQAAVYGANRSYDAAIAQVNGQLMANRASIQGNLVQAAMGDINAARSLNAQFQMQAQLENNRQRLEVARMYGSGEIYDAIAGRMYAQGMGASPATAGSSFAAGPLRDIVAPQVTAMSIDEALKYMPKEQSVQATTAQAPTIGVPGGGGGGAPMPTFNVGDINRMYEDAYRTVTGAMPDLFTDTRTPEATTTAPVPMAEGGTVRAPVVPPITWNDPPPNVDPDAVRRQWNMGVAQPFRPVAIDPEVLRRQLSMSMDVAQPYKRYSLPRPSPVVRLPYKVNGLGVPFTPPWPRRQALVPTPVMKKLLAGSATRLPLPQFEKGGTVPSGAQNFRRRRWIVGEREPEVEMQTPHGTFVAPFRNYGAYQAKIVGANGPELRQQGPDGRTFGKPLLAADGATVSGPFGFGSGGDSLDAYRRFYNTAFGRGFGRRGQRSGTAAAIDSGKEEKTVNPFDASSTAESEPPAAPLADMNNIAALQFARGKQARSIWDLGQMGRSELGISGFQNPFDVAGRFNTWSPQVQKDYLGMLRSLYQIPEEQALWMIGQALPGRRNFERQAMNVYASGG
jgi:hypothetical protein